MALGGTIPTHCVRGTKCSHYPMFENPAIKIFPVKIRDKKTLMSMCNYVLLIYNDTKICSLK